MGPLARSANVILRRFRADDLATFQAYRGDPAVARFQSWAPMSAVEDGYLVQRPS